MQICFTSDLHGEPLLYDQLEELLRAERPDLLILGGDLLADGEPDDPVSTQLAHIDRFFMPRIRTWRTMNPRLRVACLPGNHEWAPSADSLAAYERDGMITFLQPDAIREINDLRLVGYACVPATPHWVKDFERLDRPGDPMPNCVGVTWDRNYQRIKGVEPGEHYGGHGSIADELAHIPTVPPPWIFVCHGPPHNTQLDRVSGEPQPLGSRAIRDFILARQPLCSLHGHVHESPRLTGHFTHRLGNTLCVNPGQSHARLYAVLFESDAPAATIRHTVFT